MEKNKVIQLTKNSSYREQYYHGGQLWYKVFLIGKERYGYSELNNQEGTEKIIYYFCR